MHKVAPIEHGKQTFHRSVRVPAVFPQDAPRVLNGANDGIVVGIVHDGTPTLRNRDSRWGEKFRSPLALRFYVSEAIATGSCVLSTAASAFGKTSTRLGPAPCMEASGRPLIQRSLLSSGASRTASLTFARSRRSSGGSVITASWIAASIINMLSSGFSAHSHHRSKASLFVIKKVLLNPLWDRRG